MPIKYYSIPALMVLLIALPLFIFSWYFQQVDFWQDWALGMAGTYEEFCERNRMDQLIREPSNTFSNLAYVWLGFQALSFAIWDKKNKAQDNRLLQWPILSVVFALSLILLGAGSFFYHASLSHIAQRWDMTGVYSIMVFLLAYPLFHQLPNQKSQVIFTVLTILLADFLLYYFKWSLNGLVFLPGFILLVIIVIAADVLFRKAKRKFIWTISALLSLILAFTLWYLDREKILCNPDSLIQGHAAWHILTGWSSFSIYLFFRTEKKKPA